MVKKIKDDEEEVKKPEWVNPNKNQVQAPKPEWVNPNKNQVQAPKPEWVNPRQQQQQQQQPRRKEWVNPKSISARERMDRYMESRGLLNYQTQGLSQAEIAARYADAKITLANNSTWFQDNYADRQKTPNIFPQVAPEVGGSVVVGGGNADRPRNFVQTQGGMQALPQGGAGGMQYVTAPNGMTVKVTPMMQKAITTQANNAAARAQAAQEDKFLLGASHEQVKAGEANWTDMSVFDRKKLLQDPNFYKGGITQYPSWMQQQIIADPNFQWDNLPTVNVFGIDTKWNWQKTFYELSSNPAAMGAVQGTIMGLGNPGGTATGAVLGWAASKSGYDQTKEFWEQENKTAGVFGLMNWLAEQAEKAVGMGFQIANAAADENKNVVDVLNKESWNAGANFFEVITPAWIDAMNEGKGELGGDDLLKAVPGVWVLTRIWDVIKNPEKYPGEEVYLGANSPIQLDKSWIERIDQARAEIKAGRPYREVMTEMQTGVVAQMGDMVGQAFADPLNVLPAMQTKIGKTIAEAGGNKVAAEAFTGTSSLIEAQRKYSTLVQTGQALTIDPNFKLDQMGTLSRWAAGINDQGQIKAGSLTGTKAGLLEPVKDTQGWLKNMTEQTPYSRAQTGAGMFYDNVSAMLTMFDTPEEAGKYIRALSNNDMSMWKELGSRFAESPEFYTVLPALKEFAGGKLDGIVQAWEMTGPNRDLLTRVADVMGEQPGSLLDDLVRRGTAEQDFSRVVNKVSELAGKGDARAQALQVEIEAGRLNAETLKQMVDVFTGEGALPWHPGQWKAQMLDTLGSHFDEWVSKRLMLDQSPEAKSAFFRTSALMKQAQSILLLGGSPGYAITNGLSNMVHRAVSGVYGYMTSGQIDSFMNRMGMTPARMDEGVGIGGVVDQAGGKGKVQTSAMDKAVRGKGKLADAKDALAKVSKGMPFSKVSSWFEKVESRQAFTIGMKDFWSKSWRRGVGFREMSPALVKVMNEMGVDPSRIYAAIEAGMNQKEIETALMGRRAEVQARSLIHDAAEKTGMSASDAAQMLERVGILDQLDSFLAGQTTAEGVSQAFRRAQATAQEWMDMRTGEDLKARAEAAKQRVGIEGAAAALDVSQRAHGEYTDAWLNHYYRFGEVMGDLRMLEDPAQMNKAIDHAYEVSDREFRRVNATNAANYKGIFEAWGMGGDARALRVLDAMGEVDGALSGAYRQMRENWRGWREKWAGDLQNPQRWDEFEALRGSNDRLFKQAFKAKHDAEVKMGGALGEIYESLYGPAAGEAARLWWEDVVAFNDEIVKRERDFRGEMEQARRSGVPKDLLDAQKQKYYAETKPLLIVELDKINSDGVARLERVIKKGGGGGQLTVDGGRTPPPAGPVDGAQVEGLRSQEPTDTTPPPAPSPKGAGDGGADEVNALLAGAEQRKGREVAEKEARKTAVWDVAEEYWGKGRNYNRGILQDGFALVNALRKPEYGGIPDLTWLDDPRLTPELVREILENRKAAKETNAAAAAEQAFTVTEKARGRKFGVSQINEDTSILRAVALHGGLNLELVKDITGEAKAKGVPGVFTRKGVGIDEMARMLADDGYPIRIDDPNDIGGMQQARDLIQRARAGDAIYPMGHSFDAEISAAEKAWAESFDFDGVPEVPFDSGLWQTEFENAVRFADLGKVYEMIGTFPEEMLDAPSPLPSPEGRGGNWRDYLSRVADDVAARVENDTRMESVAAKAAEAEMTIREAEAHGEAMSARSILMESMADAFGLNEVESRAYGELSDAVAGWYAKMTGESADDFYNRYFGEVKKGGNGQQARLDGLMQEAFYQAEQAALTPNPSPLKGEGRVPGTIDKGMVTFEGMKATITAFEAGDFSTVIHESGHVYRRVLRDVAERTGDPYILRDLQTVEEWAGVKDGKWTREAEEKFARGFERYITEGNAPTPKLKAAFESFKQWMLDIYKTITGSNIDVKLTDDVRRVFDRMLGAENTRIDLDNMLKQMNYDPKMWYVDATGAIVPRPEFNLEVDTEAARRTVEEMDVEGMQARAAALRERMKNGAVKPFDASRSAWSTDDPELVGKIQAERNRWRTEQPLNQVERVRELTGWTLQRMVEGQRSKVEGPQVDTLFQSETPFGAYEEASGFKPSGEGLDALWREKVMPLLENMEAGAREQLTVGGGQLAVDGARDVSPEGQALLRRYMKEVQGDMASAKLATVRYAEKTRDFALLNYNKRYGIDRMADAVMPYQLYTSRSLVTWAMRALDKPAIYSNYARLKMQQDRYERDVPERLRGKIRIPAPWLPEWAGDGLYIDPFRNLFFPEAFTRHIQREQQDKNYQMIEAERVLQEWIKDGTYSEAQVMEAARSQQGQVWERAWEEAQLRRESDTANPMDFFTSFFGPAWYLSTPANLAGVKIPGISKGDPNQVNTIPLGNTARALDTVTQGTWAEPVGDLFGLIGQAEDAIRTKFELPTRGQYAEYYTKRQVANMVAEGLISPEDAHVAMIEKTGDIWTQAKERVDMELALRVPLAGVTYAALHDGPMAAAQAAVPSLFGASLLPSGELEYRGLKQEWNEAWKMADNGDTQAVQRFFDEHPEYEAYLAKGKDDGELLKSFLIGQIWDQYMELGTTNQKQARAELGELFDQAFLDKETRSYDTLDVNQLAEWARLLGARVPTPSGAIAPPPPNSPNLGEDTLKLYPEQVTGVTDQFFTQRREMFPNYYEEQQGYYALPMSERAKYLVQHPDLKKYRSWKDGWFEAYPQYVPIFKGDAFDRVDTSGWIPGLEDAVRDAAFSGGRLPEGARAALMNEWLMAGSPMDDFDTWVKSVVYPGMLYGGSE